MGSAAGAVVVTGAAGGIGLACARALALHGQLLLQDLDERRLTAAEQALASEGIPAQAIAGDPRLKRRPGVISPSMQSPSTLSPAS